MFCSVSFMSFLTILTIVEGKAPIFRTDAVFFTEAGFKKMIRGGELQMDVNSKEFDTWSPWISAKTSVSIFNHLTLGAAAVKTYLATLPG